MIKKKFSLSKVIPIFQGKNTLGETLNKSRIFSRSYNILMKITSVLTQIALLLYAVLGQMHGISSSEIKDPNDCWWLRCPEGYQKIDCSCIDCTPRLCGPGKIWSLESCTCELNIWNPKIKCPFPNFNCEEPRIWKPFPLCRCSCPDGEQENCPEWKLFDEISCCHCPQVQECDRTEFWSDYLCQCHPCLEQLCIPPEVWLPERCKCGNPNGGLNDLEGFDP